MQSNNPRVRNAGRVERNNDRLSPRRAREALSKLERPKFAFRDPAYGCVDWFEYDEAEALSDSGRRAETSQQRS